MEADWTKDARPQTLSDGLPVRRTFVGRGPLVAGVGGLGHLGLRAGEPLGELRDLAGKLQDDAVLLFDVTLQESEAFLEGALAFIHAGKMKGAGDSARRYDDSDR
jgi:hypothetical protein